MGICDAVSWAMTQGGQKEDRQRANEESGPSRRPPSDDFERPEFLGVISRLG